MKFSKQSWLKALDALHLDTEVLADLEVDWDGILARAKDGKGDAEIAELVPLDDPLDHRFGNHLLVLAMAARAIPGALSASKRHEGDLVIEGDQRTIIYGNLEVSGLLEVTASSLVVLGDLVADSYVDSSMDWASIVVAGNVGIRSVLATEGYFGVGGRMSARLAILSFNQGYTKVLSGFEGRALFESDHGGSRIFGKVAADIVINDELHLDEEPERSDFSDLLPLLADSFQEIDESSFGAAVVDALKAHDPVLR